METPPATALRCPTTLSPQEVAQRKLLLVFKPMLPTKRGNTTRSAWSLKISKKEDIKKETKTTKQEEIRKKEEKGEGKVKKNE